MIEIQGVTKRYRKLVANDNISLDVHDGELAVLLGANGAGKSTLIKSICGLLRFEGNISVCGFNNRTVQAKQILGYVPEMPALYGLLTVYEHMEFIARAYKLTNWEEDAEKLLVRFELEDKKRKLGKELSKGMQQKVSLCCALLPQPKVLILDEPMVGLDPHAIRELKHFLQELKQDNCTIIVSTHMIDSMEEDWDATYIMKTGKVAATRRRSDMQAGESLEELYFSITEGTSGRE